MLFLIFYLIAHISAAPEKQVYYEDEGLKLFEEFIKEHNKQYDHEEKEERFKIFLDNLKEINDLNEQSSHATFGITKFTDLTKEEFSKTYTGYKSEKNICKELTKPLLPKRYNYTAPAKLDWRSNGVVSRVKDQGQCGSCWAFSTTGNVESINAIKTGRIVEISEQQLVDCNEGSSGCNGGSIPEAFNYLVKNGAMSSQSYPYTAKDGQCSYNSETVVIKLQQKKVLQLNEEDIKEKLYTTGPLSIALAGIPLMGYTNGIIVGRHCTPCVFQIDHAVLLVGYGEENGVPFWLIKNSWSDSWGEEGYFRIERGVNCLGLTYNGIVSAIL